MYPDSLEELIECFKLLPGVGNKSAERYALLLLENKENIDTFIESLKNVKENIKHCEICGNISDNDICHICDDSNRNHRVICVVQSSKDIIAMEKTMEYRGVYHVLNGLISQSKGVLPTDLNIDKLLKRVKEGVDEVIIATNPTIDGETTAMYLSKLLEKENVLVTRLANGLPMGAQLDYADELTLIQAMENRRKM